MTDAPEEYGPTEKEFRAEERAEAKAAKERGEIKLDGECELIDGWTMSKSYVPIKGHEVYKVPITDVTLHELADEHPMHSPESRHAMKDDIEFNGQIEAVILYRGKIVDGRHRYWILKELGAETILVTVLPSSLTLDDVRDRVISSETRRHQTPTQRGIHAYIYSEKHSMSFSKAASKFGSSASMVKKASYADKHKGKKALYDLYHGKKVVVGMRSTDSLSVFNKLIHEELETLRKARSTSKPMAEDDVRNAAKPYLDALEQEHVDVISYVSKRAYGMAEKRQSGS